MGHKHNTSSVMNYIFTHTVEMKVRMNTIGNNILLYRVLNYLTACVLLFSKDLEDQVARVRLI